MENLINNPESSKFLGFFECNDVFSKIMKMIKSSTKLEHVYATENYFELYRNNLKCATAKQIGTFESEVKYKKLQIKENELKNKI